MQLKLKTTQKRRKLTSGASKIFFHQLLKIVIKLFLTTMMQTNQKETQNKMKKELQTRTTKPTIEFYI
jgi:hypothetical protein